MGTCRSVTVDRTVVLVIEDRAEPPLTLGALLKRDDVEVVTAHSGPEALELLHARDVALAIIDVHMAETDGFALAARVRWTDRTRYVPIIFITTSATDRAQLFQAYELGAVDVLCKPIDPHVLRSKVDVFVALERRHQLIVEAERTHEMFVGILGHDLRTPLHAIVLATELVLSHTNEEPVHALTERIRKNVERMVQMVDQLLDLTRLRIGGGVVLSPGSADLRQLAVQAVLEFEDVRHGIRIESMGDTAGTWDAARVLQIISNLVCNAIRHGSVDAPIRIVVDGMRKEAVVLRVYNAGVPIPRELRGVLFEPFRRSNARYHEPHGLGLGLYITQQLVLAHGGNVTFESSREAGTCFLVSLPRHCPDQAPREHSVAGGRGAG
jgi:signal transduction histidine kinase